MFKQLSRIVVLLVLASSTYAASYIHKGSFNIISANVAGLPQGLSSSNPSTNSKYMGPLLSAYDIVNVQEDFNYDAELTSGMSFPYRTAHSGIAGIGSGMNTFSRFPLADTKRVKWNKSYGLFSNGSDQLTPKGFTFTRVTLQSGIYLDVYNLHADADTDAGSMAARADNITQLADFIVANSAGNAVLVFGDTNCRYTREGNVVTAQMFNKAGMTDAWIQLLRNGNIPAEGSATLMDSTNRNSANNEVVDKVFYRSSPAVKLSASNYWLNDTKFVDPSGNQLSDHYPVTVHFDYALADDTQFSTSIGGAGGAGFNTLATTPSNTNITTLTVRGGSRIDAIGVSYSNGSSKSYGGTGGTAKSMTLNSGEYLSSATLCTNVQSGDYRVFYAQFVTSTGRTLTNGTMSGTCTTLSAPYGWHIGGFFGRYGTELDQLGLIYRPN